MNGLVVWFLFYNNFFYIYFMTHWNKVAQAVRIHIVLIVICAYLFLYASLCFFRYSLHFEKMSATCFHIVSSIWENLLTTNKRPDWLTRWIRSLRRLQESEVKVKLDYYLVIKGLTQRVWLLSSFTCNSDEFMIES